MAISQIKQNKYRIQVVKGHKVQNDKIIPEFYEEIFYGKKSDARIRENEIKALIKNGKLIDKGKNTFEELIEEWYKQIVLQTLEPKTINRYYGIKEEIKEKLGHYKLVNLRPIHLLEFYNNLRNDTKRNLAENTILYYYTIINTILNYGVKWKIIEENINKEIDRPKPKKKEARYYDNNDIELLLNCLKNESLKYQVIIQLALDSGCRRGELTGITWDDLNIEEATITINKVTQYVNKQIIEKDHPKNSSSIRKVTITLETLELLKKYKVEQETQKEKLGSLWKNSNKILTDNFGGNMHPDTPSKILRKIQIKYGLKELNFHGLRHTSASMLINLQVPLKVISDRLGHANSLTTDKVYSHIFKNAEQEASQKMSDKYFKKIK